MILREHEPEAERRRDLRIRNVRHDLADRPIVGSGLKVGLRIGYSGQHGGQDFGSTSKSFKEILQFVHVISSNRRSSCNSRNGRR
jgi:hypothetical protein